MSIKKIITNIRNAIRDPERDLHERVFIIFTIIAELITLAAFIGDLITKENPVECALLLFILIVVPITTFMGVRYEKTPLAIRAIVLFLVLIVLPTLFFFGGGVEGGGVLWIIFAYIYVGLVLSGRWRFAMLTLITVYSAVFYYVEYYHPEYVYHHSRSMFYIDSLISLVLVGIVCYVMTFSQNRLFEKENDRAKKEQLRAEELTTSQNRFFSSMSHEIRTPINSILGLNELILRDREASEEILKEAAGIQGSGKMLLALINDLLDFSKIEAGSMDIVPVDYNVGDMLSEIVNMVWLRATEKGLKFNININPDVPSSLYGDEVRIKQIVVNLLNNAVKYTAEGSVDLVVEPEEISEKDVMLSISVSDTGMGIKKESLPFLFDAFKRVDEEKNRYVEGTGLGLSIVKQLVELMGGTVNVNSVYGEGSMFTVKIRQGISDHGKIGNINIHNQSAAQRDTYESSFKAPEGRILMVDDNVMNLEVECKLIEDTELKIDRALSGRTALDMTLRYRYDVIFMDHMMPEMDGIECLEEIRNQVGGLNRTTPVVILTANAGSDNRNLYNSSGFDDYLVKPVSGEALEAVLIKHMPSEKLILSNRMLSMREDISTSSGYSGKVPIMITTSSVSDLPASVVRKLNLRIIPVLIRTDEGVFKDGEQIDALEVIRYMETGRDASSASPSEAAYTEFFASALKKCHHLIHIGINSAASDDNDVATEAARAFDNVTVYNSGCLSSATGLMVLIAHKLAQQNMSVEELLSELDIIKDHIRCSFIIDSTDYLAKKRFVNPLMNKLIKNLSLRPCISFKNEKSHIGPVYMGSTRRVYRNYIRNTFLTNFNPDPEVVFITYVAVPMDDLLWIKEEIEKYAHFEHYVFKQASAGISSNSGPGTFGLMFYTKSNKPYNIGSFFGELERNSDYNEDEDDESDDYTNEQDNESTSAGEIKEYYTVNESGDAFVAPGEIFMLSDSVKEHRWYENIEGIDGNLAIENSGSEDTLKKVINIFYESITEKSNELNGLYEAENWDDYVIKVHALKSSAKLIGASGFAEDAQALESAGKEKDIDYIREHHAGFMEDYHRFSEILADVCRQDDDETDEKDRPVADEYLMKSTYEGLKEAAVNMDCDTIETILNELKGYAIPKDESERFAAIREKADNYDYDGILSLLEDSDR